MAGTVYHVPPIPADPKHTTYINTGVLTFGVEFRLLDDAELQAAYEGAALEEIEAAVAGNNIDDNGVSIHVFAGADQHEYLRFDCFRNAPHYHYIERQTAKQTIVEFDPVAHGDMLDWALSQIAKGLQAMLRHAGANDVAAQINATEQQQINTSLPELERLAREAARALAAQLGES